MEAIHASEVIYELPQGTKYRISSKDGTFLFSAYGCAIQERQTKSGTYVYTVANLDSGRSEVISRRKNKLSDTDFVKVAAKISTMPIRGAGYLNIDKSPDEQASDKNRVTNIAHRVFTEILPQHGYAIREKQVELAEHILSVIMRRGISLAEAEVGTGKTHAYLIAAAFAKRGRVNDFWLRGRYRGQSWAASAHMPVIISTSSIALQQAIITDYIPELSEILMRHGIIKTPLTAAIRKGKEHYICDGRLQRFYDGTDALTKAFLVPYTGKNSPFDLTAADKLTAHVKRRICVTGRCDEDCPQHSKCRYHRHLNLLNNPTLDFQITNHNYFLADVIHRAEGRRPLLPHYQLVIVDEAHKLLQAARQMYGLELADSDIPELVQEIHTITDEKSRSSVRLPAANVGSTSRPAFLPARSVNVHRLAKKLEEQSARLFGRLNDNIPEANAADDEAERFPAVMDSEIVAGMNRIISLITNISVACADSHVQTRFRKRRKNALWKMKMLSDRIIALGRHSNLIYWLEKRTEGAKVTDALCAIPKDLDSRLHRDLWCNGIPMILTSGTLSASGQNLSGGDFTRVKETLGLNHMSDMRLANVSMPSPFDFKRNALLYISESTPFPNNKDKRYISAVADEIERLVMTSHGHAAVLFTSYNAMGQVHALLKQRGFPFPLFRLERGGTHAIEQFKQSGNGILLASGALWEGIDIPGDTLSLLVIVKLPFAVPDPIGDYERSLYGDMDTYKARAVVPDMLVKLKQGFGRLIRKETDTGVVAILDSRVREGGPFRERVLRALPECDVTASTKNVQDFITQTKLAAYFD